MGGSPGRARPPSSSLAAAPMAALSPDDDGQRVHGERCLQSAGRAFEYERAPYKQCNRIERMFGHLKIARAFATRDDQLANSFLGTVRSPPPDTGSNLSTPPR